MWQRDCPISSPSWFSRGSSHPGRSVPAPASAGRSLRLCLKQIKVIKKCDCFINFISWFLHFLNFKPWVTLPQWSLLLFFIVVSSWPPPPALPQYQSKPPNVMQAPITWSTQMLLLWWSRDAGAASTLIGVLVFYACGTDRKCNFHAVFTRKHRLPSWRNFSKNLAQFQNFLQSPSTATENFYGGSATYEGHSAGWEHNGLKVTCCGYSNENQGVGESRKMTTTATMTVKCS